MARYMCGGRSAVTGGAATDAAMNFWNPHGSISLDLREMSCYQTVATASNHVLSRTTARTAGGGTTITPDIDNHLKRRFAPISAAVLDLANLTTEPTFDPSLLASAIVPAAIGAGWIWVFVDSIELPAGTGVGIHPPGATAIQPSDFNVVWDE